jgi:hexosaminidase
MVKPTGARALVVALISSCPLLAQGLQLLPSPNQASTPSSDGAAATWKIKDSPKTIYIEEEMAATADQDGLTLIPPTGYAFADLFREDISGLTGDQWSLKRVESLPRNASGILLGSFRGNGSGLTYENGEATSEGYELVVSPTSVFVGGTGARGMWWGTRTLLQQLLISFPPGAASSSREAEVPTGRAVDAPAYATRGYMLDAGRKWYAPGLLKELCSYASFFKMSEFHYHLSDNYPLNRGRNESWQDVYSHFSLLPERDEELVGIVHGRTNETLSRDEFRDLQAHCAARGVTVVPEIEAPGHCLYLTKWRPELALPKRDLLNLSHPDTLPTVQRVWAEFLPWFETKEVHVGADEYDPTLADDYIHFVNDMAAFVRAETGGEKGVRIWGTPTDPPREVNLTISRDVVVQHWQYGQSDPRELVAAGHDVVNSQDWWAYMSLKNDHAPILPARYPQFFNESRVLDFADVPGWQWTPADFNPFNKTEQLPDGNASNRGAVMAAWNDNGPDASTQLEAYYAMRRGIALVGARAWSGARGTEVDAGDVASSVDFYSRRAPGQNLDRVVAVDAEQGSVLVAWERGDEKKLGRGSKGLNYTLSLTATGPFVLSGPDDTLTLNSEGELIFEADGYVYPLRSVSEADALNLDAGHPGRIWVNVSTSSHEPVAIPITPLGRNSNSSSSSSVDIAIATDAEHGSVAWVNGRLAGRFEVFVYGGRNTRFSWSQMAFVAPLEEVKGDGLERMSLVEGWTVPGGDGAGGGGGGSDGPSPSPVPTPGMPPHSGGTAAAVRPGIVAVVAAFVAMCACAL